LFHRNRGCHGCNGGYSCGGCNGGYSCAGCAGGTVVPSTTEPKKMPGKEKIPTPPAKGAETETDTAATVVVTLPADARLTVDGNPTKSTSERRTFVTPPLQTGADYVYTLQAEVIRDGRSVVQAQRATVRGGRTTNVSFGFSSETIASR
jgi:uncharacterized protein (TIGR03000 family)